MKKRFLPSVGWALLTLIFSVMIVGAIWVFIIFPFTDGMFIEAFSEGIGLSILFISGLVVLSVVIPCLCFCAYVMFFLSCRPIELSKEGIRQGYFRKDFWSKDEISQIGLAPLFISPRTTLPTKQSPVIYIAFGNSRRSDFTQFDVEDMWFWSALYAKSPRLLELWWRIRKKCTAYDRPDVILPDGVVWMTYSDKRYQLLQELYGDHMHPTQF